MSRAGSGAQARQTGAAALLKHPSKGTVSCGDGSALLVHAPASSFAASQHRMQELADLALRMAPMCRHLTSFPAAVVVTRNPYTAIWAEFYHQWVSRYTARLQQEKQPASAAGVSATETGGSNIRLVFNFMTDSDLDLFSAKAVGLAGTWRRAHLAVLQYRQHRPEEILTIRSEDLEATLRGDEGKTAATIHAIADFLGVPQPSSERLHCASVLAQRALAKELTPQQAATSKDQLYDGKTVCKMWSIFGDIATELGYTEPFGRMPCGGQFMETSSDETDSCGWFQWRLSSPDQQVSDWIRDCSSR